MTLRNGTEMAPTKIGRYSVLRALDQGEEAYLAEGPDGLRVVIRPLGAAGGAERERILEDARRVAALSHPSIPTAQVGLDGDQPFIVTEHIVASTFSDWLKGRPSLSERSRFVGTFAEALCHAHEQGVVHGNLNPSTVEVSDGGECVLSSFPVGGAVSRPPASAAPYLAPEVLQGGSPSQSADVFSAAVLICEAFSGKHPFARGTPAAIREAILNEQPAAMSRDVPHDLADAITACLEKDPEWRPKDLSYVAELARKSAPPTAKPISKPTAAKAAPRSSVSQAPMPSFSPKSASHSSRLPLVLIGVIGVVAAGAGAWYFLLGPGASAPQKASATPTPAPTIAPETPQPLATPSVAPSTIPTPVTVAKDLTPSPTPQPVNPFSSERPPDKPSAQPTPRPFVATPLPFTPAPTVVADARPTPTPAPATPAPTPTPQEAAESLGAASLRTVTPPVIKHGTAMIDLHGNGLRTDHRAYLLKGREVAKGISVVRQRLVSPSLLQVVLQVDPSASTGAYLLAVADSRGESSNSVRLEIAK